MQLLTLHLSYAIFYLKDETTMVTTQEFKEGIPMTKIEKGLIVIIESITKVG